MNKNDVLEILDYMFEFIFSDTKFDSNGEIDDITIKNFLTEAGFDEVNIDKAIDYLIKNGDQIPEKINNISKQSRSSVRVFSTDEINKITKRGCALLTYLEINKKITPETREIIMEHTKNNPYYYDFEEFMWLAQLATLNQDNPNLREILLNIDYEIDRGSVRH